MTASADPKRGRGRPPRRNLVAVVSIVVLSGAFFGYDQGVISGALRDIRQTFHADTFAVEVAASWVTPGALVGALLGGHLADRIGRRKALWVAAATFAVGTILQAVAPVIGVMFGARLILGLGIGVASVAGPMYAAEAAPERIRGSLLAVYQFSTTFAIFIGYLADELFEAGNSWRYLLVAAALLGVALALVTTVIPDSAVWYFGRGDRRRAEASLRATVPERKVPQRLHAIEESLSAGKAGWREVLSPQWRRPLALGVGMALFQQLTGINGIIYYADEIFSSAGFHTRRRNWPRPPGRSAGSTHSSRWSRSPSWTGSVAGRCCWSGCSAWRSRSWWSASVSPGWPRRRGRPERPGTTPPTRASSC